MVARTMLLPSRSGTASNGKCRDSAPRLPSTKIDGDEVRKYPDGSATTIVVGLCVDESININIDIDIDIDIFDDDDPRGARGL